MMRRLISVEGNPVPWTRTGYDGRSARFFTKAVMRHFQDELRLAGRRVMQSAPPIAGAVIVDSVAFLRVPESWGASRRRAALAGDIVPIARPDVDNYAKAALDALNGIAWTDDARVFDLRTRKLYASRPRLEIRFHARAAEAPEVALEQYAAMRLDGLSLREIAEAMGRRSPAGVDLSARQVCEWIEAAWLVLRPPDPA